MRFQLYRSGLAALVLSGAAVADDPEVLLQRIKAHMAQQLSELPRCTCHETIDRMIRVRGGWQPLDTVQLEVAFTGREEVFSRPGSERFGEQSVEQIAGGGTVGNSALGSHVESIFTHEGAEFKYAGSGKKDGRKTFRYNLRVPIEKSRFWVWRDGKGGRAGYEGSAWIDAETLDLVHVDLKVNRIPPSIGVRQIEESLHYRKWPIGKSEFNLPDHSRLAAIDGMGNYTMDMVKLDRCHEFAADSVVKYEPPSQETAPETGPDR
jgi:hypothetical protein